MNFQASIRRRDSLKVKETESGVLLQGMIREAGEIDLEVCWQHAVGLRDELLRLFPVTATGRKPRCDRKTEKQRIEKAANSPGAKRVYEILDRYGAGDWQTVRALQMAAVDMTEMSVRSNLHTLKKAGKVESRKSSLSSGGPRNFTEWRIKS